MAPAQRLSKAQAFRMFTEEAAFALFDEEERGVLAPGRAADLVVLSDDPIQTAPESWGDTLRVEMAVVQGEVQFERGGQSC